ncbi:DUF445 domain-containing protein [Jatrophihabitans sp. YIM 134969]
MTLPVPDPARLAALRRMKVIAGALLLVAAALFVVARVFGGDDGDPAFWGYLETTAEAAMVGGLADWFAVTALFRHPLGIPIPHTAIIPRKKDQIGESLAGFVQENFLTADIVGERLGSLHLSRRAGEFLADPGHARRLVDEAAVTLQGVSRVLRDDDIAPALAKVVEERLRALDVAPVASRVLDAVVESGQHQVALTGALRGLSHFLDENRTVFRERLAQESPEWVPSWVDDRVFDRLFRGLQTFVRDVVDGDDHQLRKRFDAYLREYAVRLREDPVTIAKLDAAKNQLLDHPAVRAWLETLWDHVKVAVLGSAADPDSELRRSATSLVVSAGRALRDDPALQARVEALVQRGVAHVVTRYGAEAGSLISSTVARWDAQETGRRLELQVGRDLQFIRINGTVVGALVGLAIHAVGQLL